MPKVDAPAAAVDLPASATLPEAAQLHEQLIAALDAAEDQLTVRLGPVRRIDTAGVVALVDLALRARQRGVTLRLEGRNEQVRAMIGLLGVGKLLGLSTDPSSANEGDD